MELSKDDLLFLEEILKGNISSMQHCLSVNLSMVDNTRVLSDCYYYYKNNSSFLVKKIHKFENLLSKVVEIREGIR